MAGKALFVAVIALLIPAAVSARTQAAPKNVGQPVVTGPIVQGQTLTTSNGTWSGSTPMTFQYRWLRCDKSGGGVEGVTCATISGETRKTYVLAGSDVGHTIRSRVIATNVDGTASHNSNPTGVVKASSTAGPPANSKPPTISGTPQEGQILKADRGTWIGAQPQTYTYQWRRCDNTGGGCADLSGANGSTYLPKSTDIGHALRVRVTGRNSLGSDSATSTPTGVVTKAPVPIGNTISIADVTLPNRLIIDRVSFSPFVLRSRRTTVVARLHVSDSQGHPVQGALVYFIGVPYGTMTQPAEQATGPDGYVTFVVKPTARLNLRAWPSQLFFVRARKAGERLIGGVSARRLVGLRLLAR
jgi:hypothetical protein